MAEPAQGAGDQGAGARRAARGGKREQVARRAQTRRLHLPARHAARRPALRAEDRRTRADGVRAPARGEVPRVRRGRVRRPDPPRPGGHHVRVQARRGRASTARSPSLADDLSLAMRAESVLIERTPGKSTVGIQIPNQHREPISLRDLLESEPYQAAPSKLTVALGKTIHGEPFLGDLAAMPHLLIAGATGTGKSVALNTMLTSILFRATPEEVRLIMIDPKRLELGMYEEIPHLLTPVVVDPKQAANALGWAVREMEERYKTLAAEGVRNIDQYNRNVRDGEPERPANRRANRCRTAPLHRRRHRRTRRPDDGGRNEVEESDRPPGPDGARGRASTCCWPRSVRRWTSSPASSRPTSPPGSRSACRRRSTRARSSTATAPNSCSGAATCSSCRRPRRGSSACTARTSRSRRRRASRRS